MTQGGTDPKIRPLPDTGALRFDPEVDFIRRYTSDVAQILRCVEPGPIVAAVSALYAAWQAEKVVMFCGNGGSGASCSHIVNDFQKGLYEAFWKPLRAISLSDCVPLMSSWANDRSWEEAFSSQVQSWIEPGCVLVGVSGSGNSMNVLNAVWTAKERGCVSIGLTGFDGGKLANAAEISIHTPTTSMQQAEDAHMVILHMLYLGLVRRIKQAQEAGK